MNWYNVQVYCDDTIEYKKVQARSYEEARDIVAVQLTVGRIIAVTKLKANPS